MGGQPNLLNTSESEKGYFLDKEKENTYESMSSLGGGLVIINS